MNHESEQGMRDQLEAMQRDRLKTARRCATMFGVISILALIAIVYGYVQQVNAERMTLLVRDYEKMALRAEGNALQQRDKLNATAAMLDSCRQLNNPRTK